MAFQQCSALLLFFIRLKLRSPLLLFISLFACVPLSIVFPQKVTRLDKQRIQLSTGFLTTLYTFFIWVNAATNTAISLRETKFKEVLLYNGMSIFIYNLAFFIVQILVLLAIILLCLVLHQISKYNEYTFYFREVPIDYFLIGLFGYALFYLLIAMLLTQCLDDQFSILFINVMVLTLKFLLFGTVGMHRLTKDEQIGHYFYFGKNFLLRIDNYWIAYSVSLFSAIFYFLIELWRHSLFFRMTVQKVCCCRRRVLHASNLYFEDQRQSTRVEYDYLLKIDQITKKYGKFRALEQVSFYIPRNQITCIVGKNGSGKTTLLKILTGHESISRGSIYLRVKDEDELINSSYFILRWKSLASQGFSTGFCAQQNNLPPSLTLSELFHLFSSIKVKPQQHREILSENSLLQQLNLSNHWNTKYSFLSTGIKRKVALMLALINKPGLILLDQPVAGLDDSSQKEFWQILGQLKGSHTIVVITHNINPAQQIADYCGILHKGEIIHFSPFAPLIQKKKAYLVLQSRHDPTQRANLNSFSQTSLTTSLEENQFFKEKRIKIKNQLALYQFLRDNQK